MPTSASQAAPELIGSIVWLALLHATWLGLAVWTLSTMVIRARSPRFRRAWLASSMLAIAIGPLLLAIAQYAWVQSRPAVATMGWALVSDGSTRAEADEAPMPFESTAKVDRPGFDAHAWFAPVTGMIRRSRPYVLTAYGLLVTIPMATLALGMVGVRRLRRESKPADPALQDRAGRLGRRLRIRPLPTILVHETLAEPCLCGVSDPAVLLPSRWLASADPAGIDAVLAHELAHARRRDPLWNLLQRLVEALLFFHPPVRWLSQALRCEGEFAADRLASRLTGDPLSLARALESLARLGIDPTLSRPVVAALGADPDSLMPRIQELIGMMPQQTRMRPWPFLALPMSAIIAALTASAQEPTPVIATPAPIEGKPFLAPSPSKAEQRLLAEKGQISLQVQAFALKEGTWSERLGNRAGKPIPIEGVPTTHFVEQKAMEKIQKELISDARVSLIQAPRVTTLAGVPGIIIMPLKPGQPEGGRPASSIVVKTRGWLSADGRHVALNVSVKAPDRDTDEFEPIAFLTGTVTSLDGKVIEQVPDQFLANTLRESSVLESANSRSIRITATVTDGTSLLLEAGRYNDQDYLILVTPRIIIPEEQEERLGIPQVVPAPKAQEEAKERLGAPMIAPSPQPSPQPASEEDKVRKTAGRAKAAGDAWNFFVGAFW